MSRTPPHGRKPNWPANLVLRNGRFYVSVRVPESLRGVVTTGRGTHLRRSLKTGHEAEALRRHRHVEAELKAMIERARREPDGTPKGKDGQEPDVAENAAWWRPVLQAAADPDDPVHIAFDNEVDKMLGEPIGDFVDEDGQQHPIYAPEREARASEFADLATGQRIPVSTELERFLAAKRGKSGEPLSSRYVSRIRRAVKGLAAWLKDRPQGDHVGGVSRYEAGLYVEHLSETCGTAQTASSLITSLSSYWKWMVKRGAAAENPWTNQAPEARISAGDADKRPYTDDEVKRLLLGDTYATLHDMMRIAALSGMRINEIGRLRVADCVGDVFNIQQAKTSAGVRRVPIHPDLSALMERRTRGKADDAFLIEELSARKDHTGDRAAKASERFTAYRRALGIDERKEGQRQSNIDFHSFRRWFVTKAEEAGQPPHIISAVVGHAEGRQGMTLGLYSGGPSDKQMREVVESVRFPPGTPAEKQSGARMGEGRWPTRR